MSYRGDRLRDTVKWFDTQKRFGFITHDNEGGDLFVHQSSIRSEGSCSLAVDESVEFQVENDINSRSKAIDVSGPDGAPVQGNNGGGSSGGGRGFGGGGRGGGRGFGGGKGGGGGHGELGHIARDCSEEGGGYGGRGGRGGYGGGGGGYGGGGGGSCYSCGESGHFARDCTSGGC